MTLPSAHCVDFTTRNRKDCSKFLSASNISHAISWHQRRNTANVRLLKPIILCSILFVVLRKRNLRCVIKGWKFLTINPKAEKDHLGAHLVVCFGFDYSMTTRFLSFFRLNVCWQKLVVVLALAQLLFQTCVVPKKGQQLRISYIPAIPW